MSSQPSKSAVPIEPSMMEGVREFADGLIRGTKGKLGAFMAPKKGPDALNSFRNEVSMSSVPDLELSIGKFAQKVSRNGLLLSKGTFEVLTAVRDALMLGIYIADQYGKASNLDQIIADETRGKIPPDRENEKLAKLNTAAAVAMYVTASYIVSELTKYKTTEVTSLKMELPQGAPPLSYMTARVAASSMIFSLAAVLELPKMVETDVQFVKMTILHAKHVIQEIVSRKDSFRFVEPFTDVTYLLRGTDFSISGFMSDLKGRSRVEFRRVQMNTIVGNRDAKRMARWLAQRVACYDPVLQKNPVSEVGSFPHITMGSGDPGTGKTELIAATANLISDYCERRGVPFLYHPFPPNIVSTFQGGSGERTVDWFMPLADSSMIIYAPIDDAEGSLQDRTDHNTSSGVKEVVQVFLVKTEGADSVQRGNYLIQIMTNLPDKVDAAVRSRVVSRFRIDGARTVEDFLDQGYLNYRRYDQMVEGFVNLTPPERYEWLSAQAPLQSMATLYVKYDTPKEEAVRDVFVSVDKKISRTSAKFVPTLLWEFQQRYPMFTSRDYRNILSAVNTRMTDFDLPEEWFDEPDLFFGKDYEYRKGALIELMKGTMKGVSFGKAYVDEAMKYMDNWVKIQDLGFEREVKKRADDMRIFAAAQRSVLEKK